MSLTAFTDLLSPELLEKLHKFTRMGNQPTRTNFFGYQPGIVGFSNAVFGFDLSDELKNEVILELVNKGAFPTAPTKFQMYVHLFSRGSFIPCHTDANYKHTGTIYLNKEWNIDLGGLFVYRDGKELKCVVPQFNTGVFFVPPVEHSTTLTAINAPMRESLQIFVEEF